MRKRLTRITTKTGDGGTTGLANGKRVDKHHPRVEALGEVDELNSLLGMILSGNPDKLLSRWLIDIQHDLFDIGGELSLPGERLVMIDQVQAIEAMIESGNGDLEPLKEFILPGGGPMAATCHYARSVCRRAERRILSLAETEPVNDCIVVYLNRLSDLLFVVARLLAQSEGRPETAWRGRRR